MSHLDRQIRWGVLSTARIATKVCQAMHDAEGAEPVAFSFPFERCDRDGRRVWCYEAVDFRPDRDIDVSWRSSR